MNRRIIANRFGLVALMSLSLFASTSAFAGAAQVPQQVVVSNTPAQPVPMVGLVKDSDAPARKPFQNFKQFGLAFDATLVGVPANQRLVIEHVSGYCNGTASGNVWLVSEDPSTNVSTGVEFLPGDMLIKTISVPVRFYADPGQNVKLRLIGGQAGSICFAAVSGYFVNLP